MTSTNSASSVDSGSDEGPQEQELAMLKLSHMLQKERTCEGINTLCMKLMASSEANRSARHCGSWGKLRRTETRTR